MKQYIDKDILATEIKRCIDDELQTIKKYTHPFYATEITRCNARIALLNQLQKFLDTLETRKENDNSLTSMDDRMRKAIIDFFSEPGRNQYILNEFSVDDIIAWLEKQGENSPVLSNSCKTGKDEKYDKPADKVEPKFEIEKGKWYVCNTSRYTDFIVGKAYYCPKNGMLKPNENEIARYVARDCFRPWTVKDAKEGDMLACESGWTCIFKTLVNDETFSSYCFMDNTKWFCETGSECHTLKEEFVKAYNGKIYPATKEQRNLLFQKMKEAGYMWDSENKQLLDLKSEPTREIKGIDGKISPKWTEEDEEEFIIAIETLYEAGQHSSAMWLKSIKQRMEQ